MRFDTDGVYTLVYTAEDDCGNTTTEEREVVVGFPRTVLYNDGTFIINESPRDRANNEALHGTPDSRHIYAPFVPNGATDADKYIFASASARLWNNAYNNIKSVEFGSDIAPTSMAYWFADCTQLASFNPIHLDTAQVVDMRSLFKGCYSLTSLVLSSFDTSNVTYMGQVFSGCTRLTELNLSNWNTAKVTHMQDMFNNCESLESLDLSMFDTSNCTQMWNMFSYCKNLKSIDLSSFNTTQVTSMSYMFQRCASLTEIDISSFEVPLISNTDSMFEGCISLKTIYTSATLSFQAASSSIYMFSNMSQNLVGGAGTTWSNTKPSNKTYAHVDGGTSNPGYFTAKTA